jgi:MoaA/NifB/PqqE/SkfB family radical SAM enzyme
MGTKEELRSLTNEYAKDLSKVIAYFPEIKKKIMFGTDYGGEETPLDEIDAYIKVVKKVFPKELHSHVFNGLAQELYLK